MLSTALARWSLQDAKAKFSELVRRALASGPQLVMRGRDEAVVVMSALDYQKLVAPEKSLIDFLAQSPLADVTLDISRPGDVGRAVGL